MDGKGPCIAGELFCRNSELKGKNKPKAAAISRRVVWRRKHFKTS
jgi:hypothetical protein